MTVQPADGLSPTAAFPDPSHDQWQTLVEGVLRKSGKEVSGSAAEEALSTTLEDGLTTRPLYTAQDETPDTGFPGFAPFTRGSRAEGNAAGGWDVRQRHTLTDPVRLNEALLGDLENGVTSLWLTVGGPAGVPVDGLARALEGVYLDLAPLAVDAPADLDAAATELLRLYGERGVAKSEARGTLGADPLGHEARTGVAADLSPAVRWARVCDADYPGIRAIAVDALPYHEAGGSAGEELGLSLATGVAYLRALTDAGMSVEAACGQLEFRYAATADQFLTIAKLRAARRLWARVAERFLRGRSSYPAAVQSAQHHARAYLPDDRIDAFAPLDVVESDGVIEVTLEGPRGPIGVRLRETLSEPIFTMCHARTPGPVRQWELVGIWGEK